MATLLGTLALLLFLPAQGASSVPGLTTRVSVASDGSQANGGSDSSAISGDSRFVVFQSLASAPLAGTDTALGQESITVTLVAPRGTGLRGRGGGPGSATLTAQGNLTLVVINIQSGPAGVAQPAHIHEGPCVTVGLIVFALSNVVNGTSTTTINATLASLRNGNHSINVHLSNAEAGVAVACGKIPATPTPAPATPTTTPSPTPLGVVQPTPTLTSPAIPAAGGEPPSGHQGLSLIIPAAVAFIWIAGSLGASGALCWRGRRHHR